MIDIDELKAVARESDDIKSSVVLQLIDSMERTERNRDMYKTQVETQVVQLEKLRSKLAELESHDSDCAKHNMPAYPNDECNCSIAKPNDYHLIEISKIRAQIEPLQKLIDHHTECHAEQVAEENVQIRKQSFHRFNNSGLHDAN